MRAFLWVQFIGSALMFLSCLVLLSGERAWPRIKKETQGDIVVKLFLTVCFGAWEAWLLWGAR